MGFWPGLRAMVIWLRVALSSVSDLTVYEVGAKEEVRRPIGAMYEAEEMGVRMEAPRVATAGCWWRACRVRKHSELGREDVRLET